jgi:hypothetical protein
MDVLKFGKVQISKSYLATVDLDEAKEHLKCISSEIVEKAWISVNGKPKPKPRKKATKND